MYFNLKNPPKTLSCNCFQQISLQGKQLSQWVNFELAQLQTTWEVGSSREPLGRQNDESCRE